MPYYLSDQTYTQLNQLLGERDGMAGGGITATAGRQFTFVKITSASHGTYHGTATYYDRDGTEISYATCAVREVTGQQLAVGRTYAAFRTGDQEHGTPTLLVLAPDEWEFVPDGCYLRIFRTGGGLTQEVAPIPMEMFDGCFPMCCGDSDSGDSQDSDSISEDGCAGWYCCQETGTVVYLRNCHEVFHYSCDDSSSGSDDECGNVPYWFGPGWYCVGFISEDTDGEGLPTPGTCGNYDDCHTLQADVDALPDVPHVRGPFVSEEQCLLHCHDDSESSGPGCDWPGNGYYCRDSGGGPTCEYWAAADDATPDEITQFCFLWHSNFDGHLWSGPYESGDCDGHCGGPPDDDSGSDGGGSGGGGDGPTTLCGCTVPEGVASVHVELNTTCMALGLQEFDLAWHPEWGTFFYSSGFPHAGGGVYQVEFDPSACEVNVNANCPDGVGLVTANIVVSPDSCSPFHLSGGDNSHGPCCEGEGWVATVTL